MIQLSNGFSESTSSADFGQERISLNVQTWKHIYHSVPHQSPPFLCVIFCPQMAPPTPSLKGQLPRSGPHTQEKVLLSPSFTPSLTHTHSLSLSAISSRLNKDGSGKRQCNGCCYGFAVHAAASVRDGSCSRLHRRRCRRLDL